MKRTIRRFSMRLVLPCCRTLVVTAALAVTSALFALSPVRPVLPTVEHLDTETVTNVSFSAWQPHLRYFTFKLAFNATSSNNVEVAFGTDCSTGTTGILPVAGGPRLSRPCQRRANRSVQMVGNPFNAELIGMKKLKETF